MYSASLQSGSHWIPVILESVPDAGQTPNIDGETDPRQVYLQHIFQPGRFPLHIISKALNVSIFWLIRGVFCKSTHMAMST